MTLAQVNLFSAVTLSRDNFFLSLEPTALRRDSIYIENKSGVEMKYFGLATHFCFLLILP